MQQKFNICFFALISALVLNANSAGAITVYDNNISALNINALTNIFMSYTNYGTNISDLFEKDDVYGTMRRVDEYGDDGSTLTTFESHDEYSKSFINDVWANANHFNADIHYGKDISEHGRFNLASVGTNTKSIELKYGEISFGGFASYINTKVSDTKSNGAVAGLFSHYTFRNLGAHTLTTIGALNNKDNHVDYNNSWINIATDIYANFKLDYTFYVKPSVYIGYTWVSSDDFTVNGDYVTTSDYNFLNLAPGLTFIKKITNNWYGSLSGKYIAHFGGDNKIYINGVSQDGLDLDNHTDIGIDLEYHFKQFVFGGNVHKQIGGIDGWNSNLNVKYIF